MINFYNDKKRTPKNNKELDNLPMSLFDNISTGQYVDSFATYPQFFCGSNGKIKDCTKMLEN